IFVVGDNPDSLNFYKQYFHQKPYLVYYCNSGNKAKSIMAGVAADVVICRLHLEDMSGKDFLRFLQNTYQHTIRIIFSSPDNKQDLMKLVASGLAQRYLCHEGENEDIEQTLTRDLLTRSRMRSKKCCDFLESGPHLPVPPDLLKELEALLQNPNYTIEGVASVIEKDPVLSSRLLHVVNSAAFSRGGTIGNLSHAIAFLGVNQIREILLFFCAMKALPAMSLCQEYAKKVSKHSFQCSKLASRIARHVIPGHEREAATAALLHDIGKLVFFSYSCARYLHFVSLRDAFDLPSTEIEEEIFGILHTELGSCLMLWWNLPMTIVETAANHNYPLIELWGIPKSVAIADRCLLEATYGKSIQTDLDTVKNIYPLEEWRALAKEIIKEDEE
ncbi:MAG: response regulator, partial [Desulfobulbaceae bacterium]|nr:response regulator [Desulfobulbaceae bacterium]MCK5341508.1 response regulator [Desulfobulbaceae bacterium]